MTFYFCKILPLMLALFSTSIVMVDAAKETTTTNANATMEQHVKEMVTWLRENNGYFNDKLEIRPADLSSTNPTSTSPTSSSFGIFAKQAISKNERLLEIPSKLILDVPEELQEEEQEYGGQLCELAHIMLEQMELGPKSFFAPYMNYLKQHKQPLHQLPATWSEPAKNLMRRVLGEIERGATDLPPSDMVDFIEDDFGSIPCFGEQEKNEEGNLNDPKEWQPIAALIVSLQRGWDSLEVLIPLYDMIRHSNDPDALNMEMTSDHETDALQVKASRTIAAGEELYVSYDDCFDCNDILWGTPEILRDFGFVESYPRTFYLDAMGLLFQVDQANDDDDDDDNDDAVQVTWLGGSPSPQGVEWMEAEYERLQDMVHGGMMAERWELMPEREHNMIFQFHQAMTEALYAAIKQARLSLSDDDDEFCYTDGTCVDVDIDLPPWFRYKDLDEPIESSDEYYKAIYQSETLVWGMEHHRMVGKDDSHYQHLEYHMDTSTNREMCFYLDGIFQICASYRPQYHELGVHATARYVPKGPKRVLWVGGGDAMFLHEILKYPDLELAVGLELDQKVTRGSFQHFGAQPHWDNEKVQWWFGDASKSLLMLPEDYFGSFDMVLVDLSDTVLSLSVTKEMDIIGALSLLLKPDGIFAMNELFFKRISDVFEHTVLIKKHLIPKVGDQAFVLASNGFNFLDRNLTNHNLENNLYIEPLSPDYDRFELVHNYRNNPDNSFKILCKADDKEEEPVEQEGSPGIFMVIEAEEVTADLGSIQDVQDAVTKALEGVGLTVESVAQRTHATRFSTSPAGETFLVLREGYVAIRTWPAHKYCAFDIHLWSAFEKHEAAKKAVIASVGGKMATSSAYRIVAGGMFGVSTWKEDAKGHGPQIHKICDPSEAPVRDAPTEPSTLKTALDTGLSLVQDNNIVVAVVCEDKEVCPTIELVKKNAKVSEVIVLSACPDVTPSDEYSEEGRKRVVECEKGILKTLQDSVTDEKRLRAIVLDTGAERLMAQIVLRILSKKSDAVDILSSDIIALATIEDQEAESWRRSFLDLFGKTVVTLDPLFKAEVMFNSTDSSMELGISSSGDKFFMQLLADTATSVEKESGLAVEIRSIHGGLWRAEPKRLMLDEEAEKLFSSESYDRTSPLEQWRSQQPLGHQTLFQLEIRNQVDDVKDAIKQAFSPTDSMEFEVQEVTSSGDGCVIVAFWAQGSAIVVWDGRIHINFNIITYFESDKIPQDLLVKMRSRLFRLDLILHDEQPRGFGRVVNFHDDLGFGERQDPLWA